MITILNDYSIQNYRLWQTLYIRSSYIMSANTNQKPTTNDKNSEISVNHQKLIDATIETIAKRGLADTTISHVAKKAAIEGIDLTFLRTIPGTIGGAVKMNAGCYGKYISDVFESANVITREGKQIILTKKDMHFDYRSSVIPKGSIITNVILKSNQAPSEDLMNKMQSALNKRSESQPVNELSCG